MDRIKKVIAILSDFKNNINDINNKNKIIEQKNIFIKKYLTPLYDQLKLVDDKKSFGQLLNKLKNDINTIVETKLNILNKNTITNQNVLPVEEIELFNKGSRHPLNIVIEDIYSFFEKFNFQLINGNEIASVLYNFDYLNIDINHPARNMHDTFFIDSKYVLRTHCTCNTAIVLHNNSLPDVRVFSFGNVYRKDEDDATHSHQFTQIDFIWLKKDFSLGNLKWIINELIKHLFGAKLKTRYRLSYFPFTEPSFEVDVECWKCKQKGCNICKGSGWIEILGAGMLHQNVIKISKTHGIDTGMAAGIGVERIAMLKYGISDIRSFYNNDFEFIKQFKNRRDM